jgi:chromosomal replication initiator protein
MNVPIPEDVLELLARRITRNVRELEGALFKLAALASLAREDITVALARTALADYLTPEHGPIEVGDIELLVAQHFGISRERLRSASRDRTVSAARAVAMYLVRHHTNLSYPEIGRALGGKNHSTVVMAVQRIEQVIAADGSVRWKSPQGRHTEAPARTLLADLAARLERRGH